MALEQRAQQIISYFEDLKNARSNWENHWQEIADHSLGRRDFTVVREPGRQRQQKIYDTTSRDSNNLLAAALHALLTNPSTSWFDLTFENADLNEDDESTRWLSTVRDRMLAAFRRPESAFTTQMHEVYSDITGFGTAGMFVADEPGFGPRFNARPLQELFIDEDSTGRIGVVMRKFKMQAWRAVDQFGAKQVPRAAEQAEKRPNTEGEYLHIVRRRDLPLPGKINSAGMPWESLYLSFNDKDIISEGGFWENPYMVARWSKDPGEIFGRGPGIDSLPDQKMLNAIWRTFIRNIEKAVDPPLLVDDDGVMPGSQLRVTPSAQITVRNDGGSREPVRYLESRAQLNLAPEIIETRARKIEKAYHSEIIQAFQDPRMTATQVIELARLSQRILSPVLGRMQVEILEPMVERVFGVLLRSGKLPDPPEVIQGEDIKIEYVSPVARAQKASEAQAIIDTFLATAQMAQADPSVLDNFDLDEAARRIAAGNGIPVQIIRSKDNVIQIRRVQAKLMQEEKQKEEALKTADVASRLIPAVAGAAGGGGGGG